MLKNKILQFFKMDAIVHIFYSSKLFFFTFLSVSVTSEKFMDQCCPHFIELKMGIIIQPVSLH